MLCGRKRRLIMFCEMWIKCVYISERKNRGFQYENWLSQGNFFGQWRALSAVLRQNGEGQQHMLL